MYDTGERTEIIAATRVIPMVLEVVEDCLMGKEHDIHLRWGELVGSIVISTGIDNMKLVDTLKEWEELTVVGQIEPQAKFPEDVYQVWSVGQGKVTPL